MTSTPVHEASDPARPSRGSGRNSDGGVAAAGDIHRPQTVGEICALVRHARRAGHRLRPVSSSRGAGATPRRALADSAVVDMTAFADVVRCDSRNRVVLFEAGVTFTALTAAARGAGLRPMLPLCPRPGQSALTAYLDREPTLCPRFQWDISDPLLCTEIILGTGELFRTGGAAGPGSLIQQWRAGDAQKSPMGPGPADFVRIFQGAQGAFGIVTWCSAKAEPLRTGEVLYVVGSDTVEPLVEFTYGLLRRNHADICFLVDGPALAALAHRDRVAFVLERQRQAAWNLVFSIAPPRFAAVEKLAYVHREVRGLSRSLRLGDDLSRFSRDREALHAVLMDPGHPANERWWKAAGHAGAEAVFLQTTLDRVPGLLAVAERVLAAEGYRGRDLLRYVQPQLGGRCCHLEFVLPTDDSGALSPLVVSLTRALRTAGGYFSRPHGPGRDAAVEGASALPLLRKLGRIFDPDGVFLHNGPAFLSSAETPPGPGRGALRSQERTPS